MIRRRYDILFRLVTQRLRQYIVDDQILRHRFTRRTRFRDHVETGLFRLDYVQKRCHTLRIHVVFHIEFRAFPLGRRKIIVMQMTQRIENCDRAERTAADPEHYKIFELAAHFFRGRYDLFHNLFLIIRKLHPAHHALAAVVRHIVKRIRRRLFHFIQLRIFKSIVSDKFLHHIVVIHRQPHTVAPIFIPEIHRKTSVSNLILSLLF